MIGYKQAERLHPPVGMEIESHQEAVLNFRTRLEEDLTPEEVLTQAYELVRAIGDTQLRQYDTAGIASDLLSDSYRDAKPFSYGLIDSPCANGSHDSWQRLILVNHHRVYLGNDGLGYFNKAGVTARHPDDPQLFILLGVMAHEAGHAILSGVGRGLDPTYKWSARLEQRRATKVFLARHPGQGFTGHWETDAAIHEERFAEGHERLVERQILKLLGYTPQESRKILKQVEHPMPVDCPPGYNQIDHIRAVTPTQGLVQLTKKSENILQQKDGRLGYEKPLSPQQMIAQLTDLAEVYSGREAIDVHAITSPEWRHHWKYLVDTQRNALISLHLRSLELRRWKALNPNIVKPIQSMRSRSRRMAAYAALYTLPMSMLVADWHERHNDKSFYEKYYFADYHALPPDSETKPPDSETKISKHK